MSDINQDKENEVENTLEDSIQDNHTENIDINPDIAAKLNSVIEKLNESENKNIKLNQTCIALSQTLDMARMRVKSLESDVKSVAIQEKTRLVSAISIKPLDLLESAEGSITLIKNLLDNKEDNIEELVSMVRLFCQGILMGKSEILESIRSQGVNQIECKLGDTVDSQMHSVVEVMKTNEVEPGKIIKVKRSGYYLMQDSKKVIIRPAEVSVAEQE
jgi:molecular chaperone GrpE (heat shock protein)